MSEQYDYLLIDDCYAPQFTKAEGEALKPILKAFVADYEVNKDRMSVDEWLERILQHHLPESDPQDIRRISEDITRTVHVQEEKYHAVRKSVQNGRSKESWFASEISKATSHLSNQEAASYLDTLDHAVKEANQSLYQTIHTQSGSISQNHNLDGFIAEQYHAQTFNLNATAKGSSYRAEVVEPNGHGYAKNSVDIIIKDGSGKIVHRYQSKYGKNAKATDRLFDHGDYRGQQKLVPTEQVSDIRSLGKRVTDRLVSPDGITSTPLEKPKAVELRDEAQSGNWKDLNWNEYQTKDLAIGIGKQTGQAALMGAAIGVGFDVAQKVWNGEEIEGSELVKTAVVSGSDFGIKAAVSGAIKVGAEKGIIRAIPKGTPAGTIANVVHVAVENVKVISKVASGEIELNDGLDRMEQVTVSTVAGILSSPKGASIGMAIGSVLGPVGTAIGGFIGGTVGYMAGSSAGQAITVGAQKIRAKAKEKVTSMLDNARNHIQNATSKLFGFLGFA